MFHYVPKNYSIAFLFIPEIAYFPVLFPIIPLYINQDIIIITHVKRISLQYEREFQYFRYL